MKQTNAKTPVAVRNCNFKKNKGITLMVLIITIIILLILLSVGINAIIDGKLISSAEDAVNETNNRIAEEQTEVDRLMGELTEVEQSQCKHEWGEWETIQDVTKTETGRRKRTCIKCGKVFEQDVVILGSYITGYDPAIGENGKTITTTYISEGTKNGATDQTFQVTSIPLWKIIGQDEAGHIIIMSDDSITTVDNKGLNLTGKNGYLNAISELDKVSSIYGQGKYADKTLYPVGNGKNKGSGGRSIRIEDLDYKIVTRTYRKVKEDDGTEYIYMKEGDGTEVKQVQQKKQLIYYNETTKEWVTLQAGDDPITFNDVKLNWINLYNISKNANGELVYCWYATKSSDVYYYLTFGSSIMALSRGNPVAIALLDSYVVQQTQTQNVQPIVFLKDNINLQYDATTKTYTIVGYK